MEKTIDGQSVGIIHGEGKYHNGINLETEECGNAICIGGIKLNIGSFNRIEEVQM